MNRLLPLFFSSSFTRLMLALVMTIGLSRAALPASAGEISTQSQNGETVVIWNSKEVYRGKASGETQAQTSSENGKELAAVTADGKVLWESEPGAAAKLKMIVPPKPANGGGNNGGNPAASDISVSTTNGATIVTFQGKQVWQGKTREQPSAKASTIDGTTYAAAFDGKRVIWENTKGAAEKVGAPVPIHKEKKGQTKRPVI